MHIKTCQHLDMVSQTFTVCVRLQYFSFTVVLVLWSVMYSLVSCTELIVISWQSADRWLSCKHGTRRPLLSARPTASQRASLPSGQYQVIVLGDKGTRVWTACLRLLHSGAWLEVLVTSYFHWKLILVFADESLVYYLNATMLRLGIGCRESVCL